MATVALEPRPAPPYEPSGPPTFAPRLSLLGLHLAVLCSFGVGWPLLGELDDGLFLVWFDYGRLEIVITALLVTLGLPLVLLAVEALASLRSQSVAWWVHLGFVAALAGILAAQLYADLAGSSGIARSFVSLVAGIGFAAAYGKRQAVRSIVTVLAPAPIVVLCLFLFFSPVAKLVLSGEGSPPTKPIALPAPVVMIVLDEFPGSALMDRRGEIDARRFPNFARLARGSTWFRNATTVHSFTEYAVPTILSGQRSKAGSLPTASDHPRSLFAMLSANPVTADEPTWNLCPRYVCPRTRSLGGQTLSLLREMAARSAKQWLPARFGDRISLAQVTERQPAVDAANLIRSVRRERRPGFHYLHLLLPHSPWVHLPSGKRYADDGNFLVGLQTPERWPRDAWSVTQAQQAFLLQLSFTDRLLGQVIDRLRSERAYDDALMVVVADHGVSFHPGEPSREVTPATAEDILPVPLFIKKPGQRHGSTSEKYVRTTDLVPTIADVLGFRLPWPTEGTSAFDPSGSAPQRLDILTRSGQRLTVDARALERRRDRAIKRQAARFGSGVDALFRIGPHAELIGRRPGRTVVMSDARAEFSQRLSIDLDAGEIPAHVAGTIAGQRANDVSELAVSVNGRIVATTRTVRRHGSVKFATLVPESAFQQGSNEVRIYSASSGRQGPRLVRLPG